MLHKDKVKFNLNRNQINIYLCLIILAKPHILEKKTAISSGLKVELEGLEPSSKQGTNLLSTCLSSLKFS